MKASSHGLSTGAKAGVGVGVALGVSILVALAFYLGLLYSRRRRHGEEDAKFSLPSEDTFQSGPPYEFSGKGQLDTPEHEWSGPEKRMAPLYETAPSRLHDTEELSALPEIKEPADAPMYIGVPAHMSGSKRWSMPGYGKN